MSYDYVSAVIPVYNSEIFIERTIASLMQQTYKLKEIIIIDNNSSDKSIEIVESLKDKTDIELVIYKLDENYGAAYARNFGMKRAKSEIVLFIDSDDMADPYLVEKQLHELIENDKKNNNQCVLVYSAYCQVDEFDKKKDKIIRGRELSFGEALGYEFVRNLIITTSGVMIKVEKAFSFGGFNERFTHSEDWDLWLKLCSIGGIAYVDEPLILVRRHNNNLSSKIPNMIKGEREVLMQYDTRIIKEAVYKRNLNVNENIIDFVSILFKLDKWEEGYLELCKIKSEDNRVKIDFLIALYYLNKKNLDNSEEYFSKAIALNPIHGAAINNLACLRAIKDDKSTAEKLLLQALEYFPNYIDAKSNLNIIKNEIEIDLKSLRFTWRELRKVLIKYDE